MEGGGEENGRPSEGREPFSSEGAQALEGAEAREPSTGWGFFSRRLQKTAWKRLAHAATKRFAPITPLSEKERVR
ncbi:MAG: hypothetical protein Kow0092_20990 [Deferrisomatales bacterium]